MWPVREVEPSGSPDLGSPLIKPLTFTYTERLCKEKAVHLPVHLISCPQD